MKLCLVSHSLVHLRQVYFADELRRQRVGLLEVFPSKWGNLSRPNGFSVHSEGDMYSFVFGVDAIKAIEKFKPDWLYLQDEPNSLVAYQMSSLSRRLRSKFACFCVPEDTIVSGKCKAIADIQIGDKVLAFDGSEADVLQTFVRDYEGELIRILPTGLLPVEITPEHPVLICKTLGAPHDWHYRTFSKPYWVKASDIQAGDFLLVPRRKGSRSSIFTFKIKNGRRKWDVKLDLTTELAKLLGLYVAEGHTSLQSRGYLHIVWSFGDHERPLVQWVHNTVEKLFGMQASIVESPSVKKRHALRVVACSSDVGQFLNKHFGKGAYNKYIPEFIYEAPYDIIRAFIEGIYLGDGHLYRTNSNHKVKFLRITTASKRLAYGLFELLCKLGVPSTITKDTGYRLWISELAWNGRKTLGGKQPPNKIRVTESHIYLPVRQVVKTYGRIRVRNLQTSSSNYCIPFTVHNCWENIPKPYEFPFQQEVLDNCDLMICGNRAAREIMLNKGVDSSKLITIPQVGVNTELFKHMEVEKEWDCIYLGRPVPEKGISYIKKACEELSLSLKMVTNTPYEQVPELLNKSKLTVSFPYETPNWAPQFEYNLAESLSCGVPVVTSDAGSIPEVYGQAKGVIIAPQRNLWQLKDSLKEALEKCSEPYLVGRRWVEKNLSNEVVANKLLEAFKLGDEK